MATKNADRLAREYLAMAQGDPVLWLREVLGCRTLYAKQEEVAEAVRDHPRVAVLGCVSSGKDFIAGRLVLWWMLSRSPAKAVVLGPSHRQVADIVWREARTAYNAAPVPLGGTMYLTSRWELSDDSYAVGFATDTEYNIQGFHSPHLLVVVTEAHAVQQSHMDAAFRLAPERFLMTGNAFADAGEFYEAFHERAHAWHPVEVGSGDTPNVKAGETVIPGMITREQVESMRDAWGEGSPLYVASVLGRFPEGLTDSIVSRQQAREAVERRLEPEGDAVLSCDVARFGTDTTVVYWRQGNVCRKVWQVQGKDTQEVAGKLASLATGPVTQVVVDDIGVGGGVVDRLREEKRKGGLKGVKITGFNGGAPPRDGEHYANAIAEAWLELGRAFKDGVIDVDDNRALVGQLTSRRSRLQGDRRLRLETKEEYKQRAGRSPDDADALAMAWSPLVQRRGYNVRFMG